MQIIETTLEAALIKASKEANCSIRELEYEVIQFPRAGFLGFFKKDAIIEVKIKKQISEETIQNIKKDLTKLFCNDFYEAKDILVISANENSVNIEIITDNSDLIAGKEFCKYKALDTIINHLVNIKYSLHARVEICGYLARLKENLDKHLQDVKNKINETGKAQTRPLETSLLNLVYEELLKEFPHKNISIKDSPLGRYIAIFGEFKKQ